MKDDNGNLIAEVVGGPDDGDFFFCADFNEGDEFTPIKTASHRPVYRFLKSGGKEPDKFVFVRFED